MKVKSESEVAQSCPTLTDHFTCLLINLYTGQEATVRTLHGTTDWFKIVKRVGQGYILSFCLFNICSKESDTTERLPFHFHALDEEMATHSSVLAWRIPGTEEPGGLPSMGSHRVRHD